MNRSNWDDVRYVLAVAEHGSLNAAASALGVTHATVLRRVAAFEAQHGCAIFAKNPGGYRLLDEARPILEAAAGVEEAVLKLERSITGSDPSPSGRVRIASTDSLSQTILPVALMGVAQDYPLIELTLLSANSHHDLSRLSADIVVRPAESLADDLVGTCVGHLAFGVYAASPDNAHWLGLRGALRKSLPAQWMAENLPPDAGRNGSDSFLVLQRLAALGHGKCFLPTLLGDGAPGLQRLPFEDPGIAVPVWVATLEEIAETPRFASVRRGLEARLPALLQPAHVLADAQVSDVGSLPESR